MIGTDCKKTCVEGEGTLRDRLLEGVFVRNAQTAPQLVREPFVALLADRFLVVLEELGLLVELLVADRARKVMHAPGLVEGGENVPGDNLVANEAQITEQLMIVRLAVGHSALLVVPMAQEGLLALGTDKVLHVPVLSQGGNNPFLDGTSTSTTNRNTHPIVTTQTIQLVHVVGCVAGTILHLTRRRVQLGPARGTVEVIPVINLSSEAKRCIINDAMALVTDMLPKSNLFLLAIAIVTKRSVLIADETRIGQWDGAPFARETLRMPVGCHRLNDAPDDEIVALVAARRKQDVEVLLAVLAPLELVEDTILELPEALGANKALRMPELAVRVDDPFVGLESLVAPGAVHGAERHVVAHSLGTWMEERMFI